MDNFLELGIKFPQSRQSENGMQESAANSNEEAFREAAEDVKEGNIDLLLGCVYQEGHLSVGAYSLASRVRC